MNPATHGMEGSASTPVLYMALELSNKSWRLALSDGAKRRQVAVPAADLVKLAEASQSCCQPRPRGPCAACSAGECVRQCVQSGLCSLQARLPRI